MTRPFDPTLPLLGALAAGFGLAVAAGWLPGGGEIKLKHLVGLLLAALVLVALGFPYVMPFFY